MRSPVKQTELGREGETRERKNGERGEIDSGDKNGGKRGGKVRNYGRQLFSLDLEWRSLEAAGHREEKARTKS